MVHDRALQRCHDGLAVLDREAEVAVKQTFPALVDADRLPANVSELVPALDRDRPFHRHRFPSEQSGAHGLRGPNNLYSTPEKLPVSTALGPEASGLEPDPSWAQ
ncbi:hypothetical protein, partial [Mesorhizobium sp.]|uniref:hypothetical protein n=1 Tax=Mesorhizobium sp. TaxID=1871066 RepID=UPI00257D0CE1